MKMGEQRGTRVYVGNLTDKIKKDDLEGEFTKYGKLNSVWIAFNPPGFAFVEFEHRDDAEKACDVLNGTELLGSQLRVEISKGRPRQGRRQRGRGGGGSGGERRGRNGDYSSSRRSGGGSSGGSGYRPRNSSGGRYQDRGYGSSSSMGRSSSGYSRDNYGSSSGGSRSGYTRDTGGGGFSRRDVYGRDGGGSSGSRSFGSSQGGGRFRSRSPMTGHRF